MRLILALALLFPLPASAGLLATVEVEAAGISQNFTGEIKGDPKDYKRDILTIIRKYTAGKRDVQFELTMRPDERGGDRVVYRVVLNVQDPEPRKLTTLVMQGRAAFPLGRTVTVFSDPGRLVRVRLDAITR
ncbi:MAG: hypothetical protein Q8T11_13765 [Elusimicrobiota bacterium]|nr:hypothetical protein [Elusimicrobiota bacterium]